MIVLQSKFEAFTGLVMEADAAVSTATAAVNVVMAAIISESCSNIVELQQVLIDLTADNNASAVPDDTASKTMYPHISRNTAYPLPYTTPLII